MEPCFLGRVDYAATFEKMRDFALNRLPGKREQLWICEHDPVFTLGLAGRLPPLTQVLWRRAAGL